MRQISRRWWGTLNLESALKTDEAEYCRRTIRGVPQPDDIVIVREGGGTGKAALVLPGQRFSLGQRVMMLRPDTTRVLAKFFLYQLLSPLIQEDQIGLLCKGSASPHLNLGALRTFPFRVPPISEHHRIVDYLDELQAKVDEIRKVQF
jgi:type I restriction enzyme, S subunit